MNEKKKWNKGHMSSQVDLTEMPEMPESNINPI